MFQTLCGEPFYYRPWEVGRLTDYQIWELLFRPAIRKQKQWDRASGKGPGLPPKRFRSKRKVPTRDQYIEVGKKLGLSAEEAGAEYDRQMAAIRVERPGPHSQAPEHGPTLG